MRWRSRGVYGWGRHRNSRLIFGSFWACIAIVGWGFPDKRCRQLGVPDRFPESHCQDLAHALGRGCMWRFQKILGTFDAGCFFVDGQKWPWPVLQRGADVVLDICDVDLCVGAVFENTRSDMAIV